MIQQHSPLYCFLLQRPSSFLYHLSFIIFPAHCGALQFLTLTSFLCFLHNSLLALHSASMFHNNCQAVLFSILSSLSPSHPVTLGLPCLFLSSCPPPSPLPAATWHHHPPLLPSAPRLPTDSPTETNCRKLCRSARFLENICGVLRVIRLSLFGIMHENHRMS